MTPLRWIVSAILWACWACALGMLLIIAGIAASGMSPVALGAFASVLLVGAWTIVRLRAGPASEGP